MMADALAHPIIQCVEPEATSRGAALLALERIGAIPDMHAGRRNMATRSSRIRQTAQLYKDALDAAAAALQQIV